MKIKIKQISKKDKKKVEFWKDQEWKIFNKGVGIFWEQKGYILAAYDQKKIVGFAKFKIVGGAGYLGELIISNRYRNKGVGGLLLKKFEEIAKKEKCHVIYLETTKQHTGAIPFYQKKGFKIVTKLKNNKFHLDWYTLEKRLKK